MVTPPPNRYPIVATILIILGVLVAVTPWFIFPVCEAKGTSGDSTEGMHVDSAKHMKCWYTAVYESGVGILILLTGLVLIALPGRLSRRTIGILDVVLGAVVLLIPTALIGVCASANAPCRIGTLPALILLGVLTAVTGIYLVISKDASTAPPS
jgi:hypothetical protein